MRLNGCRSNYDRGYLPGILRSLSGSPRAESLGCYGRSYQFPTFVPDCLSVDPTSAVCLLKSSHATDIFNYQSTSLGLSRVIGRLVVYFSSMPHLPTNIRTPPLSSVFHVLIMHRTHGKFSQYIFKYMTTLWGRQTPFGS